MTSVNTNASATTALRTLQQTSKMLDLTQNRISTGLKIGEAKDNAAYWAISTTLKSDNKSLATVKDALNLGAATVDTAYQGLNKAREVLDEIKSKLTSATQDGLDRNVIQDEINALQDQLKSIASSSIFSGENWLSVDSSIVGYNASKEIVASFARDSNNAVTIGTVTVDTSTVVLYDSSATADGILDGSKALKDADGNVLTVGGANASGTAPVAQGIDTAVATAGTSAGGASAAVANVGTLNLAGLDSTDKITFNIAVDGGAAQFIELDLSTVTGATTNAAFGTLLTTQINAVVGASAVTAAVDATTGAITITSGTTGAASAVTVTGLAAVDGDGDATSALGLSNSQIATFGTATVATSAAFAFAGTSDAGDTVSFRFQYDGDVYQSSTITLAAAETAGSYTTKLQAALNAATKVSDGTAITSGAVLANNAAGSITFSTAAAGANKNVGIVSVTTNDADADGTSAANINLGLAATVTASGTGTKPTYVLGTFDATNYDAGDRVSFGVTLYSPNVANTATVADRRELNVASAATAADFRTNLQAALNAAYGAGKVTVGGAGSSIEVTTVAEGTNTGLAFDTVTGVDGDGTATSVLGIANGTDTGTGATTLTAASALAGSAFAGPVTFDDQDTLSFNLAVSGGTATKITIDKATIDQALGGTAGTITTAAQFATVANQALVNAGISAAVTASNASGTLKFETVATGSATSLAISSVASTSGGDTISVDTIDISDTALSSAGVTTAAQRKAVLSAYISVVNEAINSITTSAAKLGAVASRIDLQSSFVDTLIDTIEEGVGNLVDADLSEESTRLQALQTKQQLGIQALSIANSSTQNVLALFQ